MPQPSLIFVLSGSCSNDLLLLSFHPDGTTALKHRGLPKKIPNGFYKTCRRPFIETYDLPSGYDNGFKRECLKMYVNGMGFRSIELVKGFHRTTVMTWVKQVGELLPDAYDPEVSLRG